MKKVFCTLGMFIVDEFEYRDAEGNLLQEQKSPQIGGGGTYAAVGARMFLQPQEIGMVIDKGYDFPADILESLSSYGKDMWLFRERQDVVTTRAINKYVGQHRGFEYRTPRIRITPNDFFSNPVFSYPLHLHFICSPTRALEILQEVKEIDGWNPLTVYEPVPDRCVPKELPALKAILGDISILSPNAEEALSLLGIDAEPTRSFVEWACEEFLRFGVGINSQGSVIIRSGGMGACVGKRGQKLRWVEAFWQQSEAEAKITDVTGAGNSFLGGLSAGLHLTDDIYEATFYASVAASFTIEQFGLPQLGANGTWNGDDPRERVKELRRRHVD